MNEHLKQEVVFEKTRLAAEFDQIIRLMQDYEVYLQNLNLDGDWRADTERLLQTQLDTLTRSRTSLHTFDLVHGLLKHVVQRLNTSTYRFSKAGVLSEGSKELEAESGESWSGSFAQMSAELALLTRNAPYAQQEKLRKFLEQVTTLVDQIRAGDQEHAQKTLGEINMLTCNTQTRELLTEVAIIARDVYKSLVDMSSNISLDSLADSPVGLTDAVEKLNSVIQRLEDAALENLDQIELLNSKSVERLKSLQDVVKALRYAQNQLMKLKAEHPELDPELERIQDRLSDEVGGRVMSLRHNLERASESYMELVASQGFHDLAGQTLRRTIKFIKHLEEQLLTLIHRYKPALEPAIAEAEEHRHDGDIQQKKSQVEVDDLLGQLGF
ncbi:MAG: protein phosphatase CheZ [Deltaproteobacteria bacterium]|nr:protein phosphatase CheZ [Deltaproteobacteria bacterium]